MPNQSNETLLMEKLANVETTRQAGEKEQGQDRHRNILSNILKVFASYINHPSTKALLKDII